MKNKCISIFFIGIFFTATFCSKSYAGSELVFREGATSIKMLVDDKKNIQLKGVIKDVSLTFNANNSLLYINFPNSKNTYYLSGAIKAAEREVSLIPQHKNFTFKYIGEVGELWEMHRGKTLCGQTYASVNLSKKLNLTLTDIGRLNMALARFLGRSTKDSCIFYEVPRALGNIVGFPLSAQGGEGSMVLKSIKHIPLLVSHPKLNNILPLPASVHVEFLQKLLKSDVRSSFIKAGKHVNASDEINLRAVRRLLENVNNRAR